MPRKEDYNQEEYLHQYQHDDKEKDSQHQVGGDQHDVEGNEH